MKYAEQIPQHDMHHAFFCDIVNFGPVWHTFITKKLSAYIVVFRDIENGTSPFWIQLFRDLVDSAAAEQAAYETFTENPRILFCINNVLI